MKHVTKKKVVICATNIIEGGPLTILYDSISTVLKQFGKDVEVIVLVKNKDIIKNKNVTIYEFPLAKKSWLNRIYHELFVFNKFSKKIKPFLWLSLQDITSRVSSHKQAVYCHCPISFYKFSIKDVYLEPSSFIRGLLYNFVYRINIHRNDYVIVQQDWMRKEFKRLFNHNKIIVAKPLLESQILTKKRDEDQKKSGKFIFIYPSLPRFQKNFEVICDAVKLLNKCNIKNFEILFTFSKNENRYAKYIYKKSKNLKQINLIGRQDIENMKSLYNKADALLFSSKLETWGLPISESKDFNLPMILADLPYAHEALGNYSKVNFFKHNDPIELSERIKEALINKWSINNINNPKPLFAENWNDLWKILLK
tara:strand:- start:504 stop:1607 length:1104 start_codon:yes stop_codon:yes gene_type:complete